MFIILLGGFFVRLYKINNPIADWHSWRQADTASVTREYIKNGLNLLVPKYHDLSSAQTGVTNLEGYRMVEFPLFNFFHYLLATNFPLSLEVSGRYISIVASLVSTMFIYLLGKKYLGDWGGVWAAFFFAFLPYNVYYSRTILPDPLAITFALAAIWFFPKSWLFSSVLFAVSLLVKPFVIFYLPVFWLLAKNKKRFIFFLALSMAPVAAWRFWISQFPSGIAHIKWMFNSDRILGKPSFWRWIFGERIGHLILGSWGLIPLALGVTSVNKKKLFPLAFFVGSLAFVFVFATANVRHDYYQLFLVPSICLLLAQGVLRLPKYLGVFAVVMMFVTSGFQIREYYKINNPVIVEAGKAVDELVPHDALVVVPYNKDTAFLYQTARRGWPFVDGTIENLIALGADYYVSVNLTDPMTQQIGQKYKALQKTDSYVIIKLR